MSEMLAMVNKSDTSGVLGILGGGQLARMITQAASDYGIRCHILTPERDSPASHVAARTVVGAYEDETALTSFASEVGVVTYEFENVPAPTARYFENRGILRPGSRALAITQDRLLEKDFLTSIGLAVAPYRRVDTVSDLKAAALDLGLPAILKTRRFGYDGKGQIRITSVEEIAPAFSSLGEVPAILEGIVPFAMEASVIAARASDGETSIFDICENEHTNHILDVTRVPAGISASASLDAKNAARLVASELEYIGVVTVELFIEKDEAGERVLVNEIAPRVHNSGHWTIEGAATSQFHQHVRAVCGLPLGSTTRRGVIEMKNLIGEDVHDWRRILAEAGTYPHLYGKVQARPGRKMGHVTRVIPEA
ncbi:5-(carboxyamino)imidazole ribonucleotide synthase [Bosea sp. RCC_152_1]|uniref:5-(carboxyamino)imidazole ribonucleotide synthase n=1 Tax=Bosea sp. RCC_152_1 TaxID=3239228 RepID=UPI003524FA92